MVIAVVLRPDHRRRLGVAHRLDRTVTGTSEDERGHDAGEDRRHAEGVVPLPVHRAHQPDEAVEQERDHERDQAEQGRPPPGVEVAHGGPRRRERRRDDALVLADTRRELVEVGPEPRDVRLDVVEAVVTLRPLAGRGDRLEPVDPTHELVRDTVDLLAHLVDALAGLLGLGLADVRAGLVLAHLVVVVAGLTEQHLRCGGEALPQVGVVTDALVEPNELLTESGQLGAVGLELGRDVGGHSGRVVVAQLVGQVVERGGAAAVAAVGGRHDRYSFSRMGYTRTSAAGMESPLFIYLYFVPLRTMCE